MNQIQKEISQSHGSYVLTQQHCSGSLLKKKKKWHVICDCEKPENFSETFLLEGYQIISVSKFIKSPRMAEACIP